MGHLQKFNFGSFCFKLLSNDLLNPNNHPKIAFGALECDWEVVRPSRLLSWIPMILMMCVRTYNVIETPFKKFLRHFKVSPHVFKMLNLGHFRPQMGIKLNKSPPECVLKHSFRLRHRMSTPFALADSLGPKHARKNLQWCSKCPRKVFGAISGSMVNSQKFNFKYSVSFLHMLT